MSNEKKYEYKKFGNIYVVKLLKDSEIISTLTEFCEETKITAGTIQGIGAINLLTLGCFDLETQKYKEKTYRGSMELTNLVGNISVQDYKTYLHCHIMASDSSYNSFGGHLISATISLTGEIFVTVLDGKINRNYDSRIGLNVFNF